MILLGTYTFTMEHTSNGSGMELKVEFRLDKEDKEISFV